MLSHPPAEAACGGGAAAALATDGAAVLPLPQARADNPGGAVFPLGLAPSAGGSLTALPDALAWAAAHRAEVEAALLAHGGIFFRGWPLPDAAAFDAFMARAAHCLLRSGDARTLFAHVRA